RQSSQQTWRKNAETCAKSWRTYGEPAALRQAGSPRILSQACAGSYAIAVGCRGHSHQTSFSRGWHSAQGGGAGILVPDNRRDATGGIWVVLFTGITCRSC